MTAVKLTKAQARKAIKASTKQWRSSEDARMMADPVLRSSEWVLAQFEDFYGKGDYVAKKEDGGIVVKILGEYFETI